MRWFWSFETWGTCECGKTLENALEFQFEKGWVSKEAAASWLGSLLFVLPGTFEMWSSEGVVNIEIDGTMKINLVLKMR